MVVVAIAGTGGVGRTILDAIHKSGEHKAIVLSRTVSSLSVAVFSRQNLIHTTQAATSDSRRIAVDYSNVDEIKRVLQEHQVEVVVSALLLADESAVKSQNNLVRAAARSGTVNRFVPSEYYIDFHAPIP